MKDETPIPGLNGRTFPHKVEKGKSKGRPHECQRNQQVRERYYELMAQPGMKRKKAIRTLAQEISREESVVARIIHPPPSSYEGRLATN